MRRAEAAWRVRDAEWIASRELPDTVTVNGRVLEVRDGTVRPVEK